MHTSKAVRSLTLVASLAAGITLASVSPSAFAKDPNAPTPKPFFLSNKTVTANSQTMPKSKATTISTGPNNTATVHVGSGGNSRTTTPGKPDTTHSVMVQNEKGKIIYYFNPRTGVFININPTTGKRIVNPNLPNNGDPRVHFGPGGNAGRTPNPNIPVSVQDQNGETIYYNNPHERVVIGTTLDGKPIYDPNRTISEKIYLQINNDGSIDRVQQTVENGQISTRVIDQYKPARPPKQLGSCPPWGC